MSWQSRAALVVAAFLVAGGVLAFVATRGASSLLNTGSVDVEACARLDPPSEAARCLDPFFRAAAQKDDAAAALSTIDGLFKRGALDDCHMLAHALGHVAFDTAHDFVAAMAEGSGACNGGYWHGVVEEALARGYGVSSQGNVSVLGWCDPIAGAPGMEYMECIHGLGHGLMYRSGHDVVGSLAACDQLGWDDERNYCADGVFMENALQYRDLGESAYLDAAPHACDRLPLTLSEFQSCFSNIGEVAMMHYHHDLDRANALCATIPDDSARSQCASGATTEERIVEYQRAHE
ncbi:MAG: hypothetical protein ACYDCK_06570 [Thermoplasmatota archaeon]